MLIPAMLLVLFSFFLLCCYILLYCYRELFENVVLCLSKNLKSTYTEDHFM